MDTSTTVEQDRTAFGEFLRQARERRRLTLEQIAGETKIAARLLTSLEQGNVQPMPKGMYRRAMLRAYAESVGLDPKAALTEFERTFEEPPPRDVPSPTLPAPVRNVRASANRPRGRRGVPMLLVGAAVAAAVGLGVWATSGNTDPVAPVRSAAVAEPQAALRHVPDRTESRPASAPARSRPATRPETSSSRTTPSAMVPTSGTREEAPSAKAPSVTPAPQTPPATEGQVTVVSEPPGARVTVNGVGWGSTPVTIRYLALGDKRVRVTKDGFVSQERQVRVDGRRPNATVRVTLAERR